MNETFASQQDASTLSAKAFNAGADARLAGKPLSANPHPSLSRYYTPWRDGWEHVERFWACDVRGRRVVMRLSPVRGEASP